MWPGTDVATGPYQSKPTTGVYNATGELINVIDTPAGETRRSIAADGSDFGSDQMMMERRMTLSIMLPKLLALMVWWM